MLYLYNYLIERRMHAAVESIYNSFDSITQMIRGSSTRLPLILKKSAKKITVGILIFLKKSDSKIFIQISIDIKIRSSWLLFCSKQTTLVVSLILYKIFDDIIPDPNCVMEFT